MQQSTYNIVQDGVNNGLDNKSIIVNLAAAYPDRDPKKLKSLGYSLAWRLRKRVNQSQSVTVEATPELIMDGEIDYSIVDRCKAVMAVSPNLKIKRMSVPACIYEDQNEEIEVQTS